MMFKRPPDFVITNARNANDPYLLRWWLIPRNRWFNVYLHKVLRSDDDRALHDHPWWNVSVVLAGGYIEVTPKRRGWRAPGSIVFRRATAAHRLVIDPQRAPHAWTLFITGPRLRAWGFHCPKGWVHWREFVDDLDTGRIGRGCGEH